MATAYNAVGSGEFGIVDSSILSHSLHCSFLSSPLNSVLVVNKKKLAVVKRRIIDRTRRRADETGKIS